MSASTMISFSMQFGNAVLSRYPIKASSLIPFPGYASWETILGGKSDAILCEIVLSEKLIIRFLGTHLESRSEAIRLESAKIIEKVRKDSSMPFFIAGDLNSSPEGFPCSQQINGQNTLSVLLESGNYLTLPVENPSTSDFTITTGNPCAVVDWVLVPKSWKIVSRKVIPSLASDHYWTAAGRCAVSHYLSWTGQLQYYRAIQ